jgi:outer membrane protein OmpA-like peptidoglycan-associated protein
LNSYTLREDAKEELLKFVGAAELITENNEITDWCIKVVGHTDKSGSNAINNWLSKKRAESVRDALVKDGKVPESNVYWYGVGSADCATTTEGGQDAECRKVVITYLAQSCEAVKESKK